ncbi:MAG: nucleoside hydrolase [Actinomycetota bacterium]|jgi:inosine-uridine nucleoside N-ribohydrolase|nr:nucleoside hydrolase [Ilumatobacteraceae bacterium]MDA2959126.1 nucleoside hydrolase [Actinomycetota bacterium]MDA3006981.1 nucleoside hydrolase [Actinomycetota bacterium]MDA3034977.1 nucleoside hydrolase [Actinomycetota bacterium]
MTSARPAIILDCDPGHDDAVAIVLAAHLCDVLGITTVAGNAPLERTTYNARVMRHLLNLNTEVHSGADAPLVVPAAAAGYVHGESGLDGAELPEPTRPVDGTDAVGFIIDTVRTNPGCSLVVTGPMTNVALAITSAPDIVDLVAEISFMGGGTFGNRTTMAEFNLWADPHAAATVVRSGAPLVMAGLDVTHRFQATEPRITAVRAVGGTLATTLADLFDFFSENYRSRHDDMAGAAVHDPLSVLAVCRPDLFTSTARFVDIVTDGEHTRGMTVIDRRTLLDRPVANCTVLDDVDADAAWQIVVDAVAAATH